VRGECVEGEVLGVALVVASEGGDYQEREEEVDCQGDGGGDKDCLVAVSWCVKKSVW
jgi:hypothetical protein